MPMDYALLAEVTREAVERRQRQKPSNLLARVLRDAHEAAQEAKTRRLLERWVSELEPAIVYKDGAIIGLCDAAADVGSKPFVMLDE